MWRWEDMKIRRCEDEQMWRWADVKMRRCEDEKMWRWKGVREGVKMSRCEDEQMWRWADVKMRRCERRCEDEQMWRWEDVREGVKMRRWDTDPHYWKNPALRRSREKQIYRICMRLFFKWVTDLFWHCIRNIIYICICKWLVFFAKQCFIFGFRWKFQLTY